MRVRGRPTRISSGWHRRKPLRHGAQVRHLDVEDDPVADARPVGVMRKEYEFRAGIDEPLDQPGAGDAAH